jgi:hypothetical protein
MTELEYMINMEYHQSGLEALLFEKHLYDNKGYHNKVLDEVYIQLLNDISNKKVVIRELKLEHIGI